MPDSTKVATKAADNAFSCRLLRQPCQEPVEKAYKVCRSPRKSCRPRAPTRRTRRFSRALPGHLRRGLEVAQCVTDLRRLFVILPPHGVVEGVLEPFAFRERTFGVDLPQPGLQRLNFAALFQQVLARMLPIKLTNFLPASLDHLH